MGQERPTLQPLGAGAHWLEMGQGISSVKHVTLTIGLLNLTASDSNEPLEILMRFLVI